MKNFNALKEITQWEMFENIIRININEFSNVLPETFQDFIDEINMRGENETDFQLKLVGFCMQHCNIDNLQCISMPENQFINNFQQMCDFYKKNYGRLEVMRNELSKSSNKSSTLVFQYHDAKNQCVDQH